MNASLSPSLLALRLLAQVSIHRLDEHVRRPRPGFRAVPAIVVERRPRRLDLLQRQTALDHVLDAVPDDRDHVAILEDVGFVAQASMPGDDVGAALLLV